MTHLRKPLLALALALAALVGVIAVQVLSGAEPGSQAATVVGTPRA